MVHLVYCDDKAKVLDKIMNGSKINDRSWSGRKKNPPQPGKRR